MGKVKVCLKSFMMYWLLLALTFTHAVYAQSSFGTATANMLDSGLMNAHYTISSNHFAFIFNDSGVNSDFSYAFQLCAQNLPCTTYSFSIFLTPNQGVNLNFIVTKDIIYTVPGRYILTAKTFISGPSVNILAENTAPAIIIDPNVLPH